MKAQSASTVLVRPDNYADGSASTLKSSIALIHALRATLHGTHAGHGGLGGTPSATWHDQLKTAHTQPLRGLRMTHQQMGSLFFSESRFCP
jgi:hypothetical protein